MGKDKILPRVKCPVCNGYGKVGRYGKYKCMHCNGLGLVIKTNRLNS